MSTAAGDARARRDRMIRALKDFQEPARAAAGHWGSQDLTVGQGLAITWLLGNIIRDLRIATASAGNLGIAEGPGADTGEQLHRLRHGVPRRPATPAARIADAVHHLHIAGQQAIAVSAWYGPRPAIQQPHDIPAIAAARQMQAALGVAEDVWRIPVDRDEDRDPVVTQMLLAVDRLEVATLALSQGGPADARHSLPGLAFSLDCCCHYLRESLACSLTGAYQPGTEDLAREVRGRYPLISETSESPFPPVFDFTGDAPAAAGTAFPPPPTRPRPAAKLRPSRPRPPGSSTPAR